MTPQQFIAQYNGKQVDLDGFPKEQPFQCYDLVNQWSLTLGYSRFAGLYAYNIFGQQPQNYTSISNSPTAVPQAGDIIVWNNNYGGGFGHTAIANGDGNATYFVSFDQNWQPGSPAVLVRHNYNGVIWLAKYLANELSKDLKEHTQAAVKQQEASKIQADASRESAKASREMVTFMRKLNGKLPHLVEDRKAERLMEDKK